MMIDADHEPRVGAGNADERHQLPDALGHDRQRAEFVVRVDLADIEALIGLAGDILAGL